MSMNETCPCRKCEAPKRHLGCHADCEEYKQWKAEYAEISNKGRAEKDYMNFLRDTVSRKMHIESRKAK